MEGTAEKKSRLQKSNSAAAQPIDSEQRLVLGLAHSYKLTRAGNHIKQPNPLSLAISVRWRTDYLSQALRSIPRLPSKTCIYGVATWTRGQAWARYYMYAYGAATISSKPMASTMCAECPSSLLRTITVRDSPRATPKDPTTRCAMNRGLVSQTVGRSSPPSN